MKVTELPGISVIVPSFNHGRFIDETIGSLINQNYPNLEVIVIDGNSTDDTIDILKRYGEKIKWVSEKDNGQSDAIVKGFKKARNNWLTWLNSDDIQCNQALWKIANAITRFPNADVFVGNGHYMDINGSHSRPYPRIFIRRNIEIRNELFEKGYLAQPSVYFKKSAYNAVGGINVNLRFCMDYDLWVRFAISGFKFMGIEADISGNRWHEDTKTAASLLDLLSEVALTQNKYFGKISPFVVQAISDNLYHKLHSAHYGDLYHIFYRWLYFKSCWIWLNMHRPLYCIRGLISHSLAKSGPIKNDLLTWPEFFRGVHLTLKKIFN